MTFDTAREKIAASVPGSCNDQNELTEKELSMTTLKKITEIAQTGCINDPVRVRSIMREFTDMPMKEIFDCADHKRRELFDELASIRCIEPSLLDRITYPDIVGLIDSLEEDHGLVTYKRFCVEQLKRVLLDAGQKHLLVREFLGISIAALFDYFENRHHDLDADRIYMRVYIGVRLICEAGKTANTSPHSASKSRESTNVGDLLKETMNIGNRGWLCWKSIEDYQRKIMKAHSLVYDVLISGFKTGYRERMCINDLSERYSETGQDNGYQDFAAFFGAIPDKGKEEE